MDEETTRLHQRLDMFWAKLNDLDKSMLAISAGCIPCRAKVENLDSVINGNGRDGLKTDVRALQVLIEDVHKKQEERLSKIHNEQVYLSKWIKRQVGAIIAGTFALLILLAQYLLGV